LFCLKYLSLECHDTLMHDALCMRRCSSIVISLHDFCG